MSYVKVLNTSVDILMPAQVYNASGIVVGVYVYYDGSLEYIGRDHLPYALYLLSLCLLHSILYPFYYFISIPVDAFNPVLTAHRKFF